MKTYSFPIEKRTTYPLSERDAGEIIPMSRVRSLKSSALRCFCVAIVFLASLRGVLAQESSDSDLEKKVLGVWTLTNKWFVGTITIDSKGAFDTKAIYLSSAYPRESDEIKGRWHIRNGYLIFTVTSTTCGDQSIGHVERYKIVRVTETELIYTQEGNRDNVSLTGC